MTTPGMEPQTSAPTTSDSNVFSILAIVFGAVAVLFLPIVFGVAAIVLAIIAMKKNERLAKVGLTVAVVGTVLGFVLGAVVYNSMN